MRYNSYGSAVRVSAIIRYRSAVEIAILSTKGQRGSLVNTASVRATRLFACVFLLGHVGFAQKILVRVINGRDGHPLSTVFAEFLDEQPTKCRLLSKSQPMAMERRRLAFQSLGPAPQHSLGSDAGSLALFLLGND